MFSWSWIRGGMRIVLLPSVKVSFWIRTQREAFMSWMVLGLHQYYPVGHIL